MQSFDRQCQFSPTHPLRKLEQLDNQLEPVSMQTGSQRWMVPYADLLTLLLGILVIVFGVTHHPMGNTSDVPEVTSDGVAMMTQPVVDIDTTQPAEETSEAAQGLEERIVNELNLEGQQVTVRQDPRGMVISFQDRLFFEPGQARLTPQSQQTLDKLAEILKTTSHPLIVEGHTDDTPIQTQMFPSNWELSVARATVIVKALIHQHQFPPQRLSAAGYGEFHPLADNSTIEGKQKNRRVDIVLINPQPMVPESAQDVIPKEESLPVKPS